MKLAQSPHVPKHGKRPGWRDIAWLTAYSVRALLELAQARIVFERLEAKAIPQRNLSARDSASLNADAREETLARIAYVVPRLSDRLPWRSDCVVQAIAGQNWLAAMGLYGEIQIGVENPQDGDFGAHAWLICGDSVVTGGDVSKYDLILEGPKDEVSDEASP